MRENKLSLKVILNVMFILFVVIIIIASAVISSVATKREVARNINRAAVNSLQDKSVVVDRTMSHIFEQLVNIGNNPTILYAINNRDEDLSKIVELSRDVKGIYYRFQDVIDSIYININDGEYYFNGGQPKLDLNDEEFNSFFDKSKDGNDYYFLSPIESPFSDEKASVISAVKLIGDKTSLAKGVIVINIKYSYIEDILKEGYVSENSRTIIVDENDSAISANEKLPKNLDKKSSKTHEILTKSLKYADWKLYLYYPVSDLKSDSKLFISVAMVLFAIMLFTAFVIWKFIGNFVTKPIEQLAKRISKTDIMEEQENVDKSYYEYKEIEILDSSFKEMIANNKELVSQNERAYKERRELEAELLQAQINPHFLYNTLFSIESLSSMKMNEESAKMARALADFYRIGISEGEVLIPIVEEIEHVTKYLEIMGFRYHDNFEYSINISDRSIYANLIPKVSIQPIVENALYHGFKDVISKRKIEISAYQNGDDICIDIEDNGKGLEKEIIERINVELDAEKRVENGIVGIGLRSVNYRIRHYFGAEYGLRILPKDSGLIVRIRIAGKPEVTK